MSEAAMLSWLLEVLVWTGVVFVIVRLADGLLSRWLGPRARMALYALVFVRLVLPPGYASPLGLAPGATEPAPLAASELGDPTAVTVPWLSRDHVASSTASTIDTPMPAPWWPWIYGAGLVALLGIGVRRHRTLMRIVDEATPHERLDGVEIRIHPEAGPFAHGILRRVIVLPRGLVDSVSPSALAVVVAHERAHHTGRDPILVPLLGLSCALAWPVLPVWLARRRIRMLIEHAADERAVTTSGGTRKDYGRVLLGLVDHAASAPTPLPSLGAYRDLRARISAVLRPVTTSSSVQLVGVAGISAAVLACAAVPTDNAPEPIERVVDCDAARDRALQAHDVAEREASPARRSDALAAYAEYEEACADHPEYADTLYYAAEAHWADAVAKYDAGQRQAAAQSFGRARTLFDTAIDEGSSFAKDAALGQHLAVKNEEGWLPSNETNACEGEGCDDFPFIPYDASETAVLESWERYVQVHGRPVGVDADGLLDIAYLRMRHNDFEANVPDLEELTERHAGTEAGLRGAEMLVDVLTIQWVAAEGEARGIAGDTLVAWLDRIAASPTVEVPGSERLVQAIATLKQGVAWKAAQPD